MRIMKWIILAVFAVLLAAPSASVAQQAWGTGAIYEGAAPVHDVPDSSSAASVTPFRFQSTRIMVGERAGVGHFWSNYIAALPDDNGLHRVGTARVYMQTAAPTTLADSHTDAAGATDLNNTGAAGLTDFNDGASNSGAVVAEDDIGHGRIWIDTDDSYRMYVYEGEIGDDTPVVIEDGWKEVIADGGLGINAQGYNILFNGSFEDSGVAGPVAFALDGWSTGGGAGTYSYALTDPTNGVGMSFSVTGTGANSSITQSMASLKEASTYFAIARVKGNGTGTCDMDTTGAAVTDLASSTASVTWTTISGTFVTDAAAVDTVQLELITTDIGGSCVWDHVAVYETNAEPIPQPGVLSIVDSDAVQNAGLFVHTGLTDSTLAVSVTVPGAGYIIMVNARIEVENPDAVAHGFQAALLEDASIVDALEASVIAAGDESAISLRYVNTSPTPGNTYDYTVEGAPSSGTTAFNFNTGAASFVTPRSFLEVTLVPIR